MSAEVEVTLKCDGCNRYAEIDEDFDDYYCEDCRIKGCDTEVLIAIREAVSRCIIDDEEIKKTEDGDDGWIWLGECTEREKEMFINGARFGGTQVLFKIADELNIVPEWEKIREEFLRGKK